jgi:hypothetical protein
LLELAFWRNAVEVLQNFRLCIAIEKDIRFSSGLLLTNRGSQKVCNSVGQALAPFQRSVLRLRTGRISKKNTFSSQKDGFERHRQQSRKDEVEVKQKTLKCLRKHLFQSVSNETAVRRRQK